MDQLTLSTRRVNAMLDALPGPKSECCGAPLVNAYDNNDLVMCTGCARLYTEEEL